jgi:hypothetical protein
MGAGPGTAGLPLSKALELVAAGGQPARSYPRGTFVIENPSGRLRRR